MNDKEPSNEDNTKQPRGEGKSGQPGDKDKDKQPEDQVEAERLGNSYENCNIAWLTIKHKGLFEHIIALGSRTDMLVTANSILIAGLLIILFGSTESQALRSRVGDVFPQKCLMLLGLSLVLCVVSIFFRVRHGKDQLPFFDREHIENLEQLAKEVDRYKEAAAESTDMRHLLLNLAAVSLLIALVLFAFIVYRCFT